MGRCCAGMRPTSSLEEFFGEDIDMLESSSSHIELAKQLRQAGLSKESPDHDQQDDWEDNANMQSGEHASTPG